MDTTHGWQGNHTWGTARRNNGANARIGGARNNGLGAGAATAAVTLLRDVPLPLDVLGDLLVGRLWGASRSRAACDQNESASGFDHAAGRLVPTTPRRLPPGALAVLRELLRHLGRHSNRVWPSQARIAERTGLSHASVERGVALLKRTGWIRCCSGGDENAENGAPGPRPRSVGDMRPAYCAVNCYDLSALLALVPAFLRFRPAKTDKRDAPPPCAVVFAATRTDETPPAPFAPTATANAYATAKNPRSVCGAGGAARRPVRAADVAANRARMNSFPQDERSANAAAPRSFFAVTAAPVERGAFSPHFCGTEARRPLCGLATSRAVGPALSEVIVIDNNNNIKNNIRCVRFDNRSVLTGDAAQSRDNSNNAGSPGDNGGSGNGDKEDKQEGDGDIRPTTEQDDAKNVPGANAAPPTGNAPTNAETARTGNVNAALNAIYEEFPDPFADLDTSPSQTGSSPRAADADAPPAQGVPAPAPPVSESPLVAALIAFRVAPRIARRLVAEKGDDAVALCLRVAQKQRMPVGPGWLVAALTEDWELPETKTGLPAHPAIPPRRPSAQTPAPPKPEPALDLLGALAPGDRDALEARARAEIIAETPLWNRPGGPPLPRAAVQWRMRALLARKAS